MSIVTCVVCGKEEETGRPMAHDDCICGACRGRRRIARMIDVIKRDLKVPTYDWDGTPAPPVGVSTLNRLKDR